MGEPDRSQMTVWNMRIECWIPKATNAHFWNMQYLLLFYCNNGCINAPHCYMIQTLPALL
jgi:hypothetical protein